MPNITSLTYISLLCGGSALLAQVTQSHELDVITDLIKGGGTGGLILCLLIAIKHLNSARNDTAEKVVNLLEGKMAQNTEAFKDFKTEMHANTLQAKEQCRLLQAILFEFRIGQKELEEKEKHGHDKKS